MNKRTLMAGLLAIGVTLSATERSFGAKQSDLLDDYDTGLKYFRGGGDLLIDHTKAYEHFRRAAEGGLPEAQVEMALAYQERGLFDFLHAADPKTAADWARRAVKGGLEAKAADQRRAQYELGNLYLSGLGVEKNDTQARQCYERAADNGSADAKRALGFVYLAGRGATQDTATAMKYFEEAATARLATAQLFLGILYSSGKGKDPVKAAEMFRRAADQASPPAQDELGNRYEKGEGVTQSFTKAAELYQKAADRGYWNALMHLASLYESGNGVPKDESKAAELYQKVADQEMKQGKEALNRLRAARK